MAAKNPKYLDIFALLGKCLVLLMLLLLLVSQMHITVVRAQDIITLYEENFDDNEFNGWNIDTYEVGNLFADDGYLIANGGAWAAYDEINLGSGTHFEVDIVYLEPGTGFNINLQVSNSGFYSVQILRAGEEQLFLSISRIDSTIGTQNLSNNDDQLFQYAPDRIYHVDIFVEDGNLNLYIIKQEQNVEGVGFLPALSAKDDNPLPSGSVAIEFYDASYAVLDNLIISGPPKMGETDVERLAEIPDFAQCYGQDLLYAEDFEDQQAQGWDLEGEWVVEKGMLVGNGHYFANNFTEQWEDLSLYVVFMFPSQLEELHINARVSEVGRYFLSLNHSYLSLNKQLGWGRGEEAFIKLESLSVPISLKSYHTVGFSVSEGLLEVTLDGIPYLSTLDEDYLPAGNISLETLDNSVALIDSVWVCEKMIPTAIEEIPPDSFEPTEPAGLPDLVIADLYIGHFDQNSLILPLAITVINSGDTYSNDTHLLIQQSDGAAVEVSKSIGILDPNQTSEIYINLEIPEALLGNSVQFEIVLDPQNLVSEQDENNNLLITDPIEFPSAPSKPEWGAYLIPAAVVSSIAAIILFARAIHRKGKAKQRKKNKPAPVPPITPPLRLLRLWITEGHSDNGPKIHKEQPLIKGKTYTLHARVLSNGAQNIPRGSSAVQPGISYDLVVFSPESDYRVTKGNKKIRLTSFNSSKETTWSITPNQTGTRRVRVCLFYGNLLLQTGYIDAQVSTKKGRRAKKTNNGTDYLSSKLDYVANATLTGFENEPQPSLSILTNQDANGKDWIAVYAGGDSIMGTTDSQPRLINPDYITSRAQVIRNSLWHIIQNSQYQADDIDPTTLTKLQERLEKDLARLAREGWATFDDLFLHEITREMKRKYEEKIRAPGLISIVRCRGDKSTLPWASIYDLYLDAADLSRLKLCPIIKTELKSHWNENLSLFNPHNDLLDNPKGCRDNPQCPLNDRDLRPYTICPFGFWGFRHQISQPQQLINVNNKGEIPQAISHSVRDGNTTRFDQTIYLKRNRDQAIKIVVGVNPHINHADQLAPAFEALQPTGIETSASTKRDEIKQILENGGFHICLLYCHGEIDRVGKRFKLDFGEQTLSWENLDPYALWPLEPKPLVILNACNTVSTTPEVLYRLLDGLHELGASGVIGTETKVSPKLAYEFIISVMKRFIVNGDSIGEAFWEERKTLLRHFSPLGLVYSYFAPAALHLHQDGDCSWCTSHGIHEDVTTNA